jgi:ribonuclease BN (tRNA processing enzyme)
VRIFFLGTNGWYDTKTGNTTCVLVDSERYYVIFDAGNGIHKADRYIREEKPIYLFLSHFHIDHIAGLHILNKFQFPQGLKLFGQANTRRILKKIIDAPFTVPFEKLPYPLEIHELSEGIHKIPFSVECRQLLHSTPCFGYRLRIDKKNIAFCTDTGMCDGLVRLGNKADLLIVECSNVSGQYNESWPHLNPENIIELFDRAAPKRIALVHFDANNYRSRDDRLKIARNFLKYDDKLIISSDDLELDI